MTTIFVLTDAVLGDVEDDKPSDVFEELLAAPSVFSSWQAAANAAQSEYEGIWKDQSDDPAPQLDWEHTGGREWNAGADDWGIAWRITMMEVK